MKSLIIEQLNLSWMATPRKIRQRCLPKWMGVDLLQATRITALNGGTEKTCNEIGGVYSCYGAPTLYSEKIIETQEVAVSIRYVACWLDCYNIPWTGLLENQMRVGQVKSGFSDLDHVWSHRPACGTKIQKNLRFLNSRWPRWHHWRAGTVCALVFFLDERQYSSFCEKIDIHSVILWENVGHLPRFVRYIIAEKEQLRSTVLSSLFSYHSICDNFAQKTLSEDILASAEFRSLFYLRTKKRNLSI